MDDPSTYSLGDQCVVLAGRCMVEAANAVTPAAGSEAQHTFLHRAVDHVLQLSLAPGMEMGDVAVVRRCAGVCG